MDVLDMTLMVFWKYGMNISLICVQSMMKNISKILMNGSRIKPNSKILILFLKENLFLMK